MPKQNPYKNPTIGTQEPKWIVPVQPVKTTSKDNGYVISELYHNSLNKIADDTKSNFQNSKFKIGDRTYVVMMVDDENTIKAKHLGENDLFLFEITRNHSSISDSRGDWQFSRVLVTEAYSENEADGCFFNGIAEIGNEITKSKGEHLFCVKRIDENGKPIYNLAKFNPVHKKLMAGSLTSTNPITFEEDQNICPLFNQEGQCYAGINTNGEKTPAPFSIEIDGKDNK